MNKKIFKFKAEYAKLVKGMTDKQAGEFIKAVCERVYEGKPFVTKDSYLKGVFILIERDLQVSSQNSINGKKGSDILAGRKREAVSTNIELVVVADKRGTSKVE